MSSDYSALTIREAGGLLASLAVSAVELVDATSRRIDETEPIIHSYALVLADATRMAAIELDR
jgi:Asp-tRNA(Asn)/Glu-tRNA(Gln) amidotransferase A subunit family amidase